VVEQQRRREPLRAERLPPAPSRRERIRDLRVPWPVVLFAPLLAATPVLLAWALVGVFGSLAGLAAAATKALSRSSLGPLAGLALGLATVAGLVVVATAAIDAWRRRGGLPPWLAPVTAVAVGCVLTPLALLAGAGWLAPRTAGQGDTAKLFAELRSAYDRTGGWILAGLVLGAIVVAALARAGRLDAIRRWLERQRAAWRAAADEPRPDPEAWRR
jgi:hypothetical protein